MQKKILYKRIWNQTKTTMSMYSYLGMLTRVENLAALLTAQAGGMPVETQRLTPFSWQIKTVITTQAENQNIVTIQFRTFACHTYILPVFMLESVKFPVCIHVFSYCCVYMKRLCEFIYWIHLLLKYSSYLSTVLFQYPTKCRNRIFKTILYF